MSSCICELLETLVKNRLQWYLESNKLLSPLQSGFRKGQSCVDNLTNLKLLIEEGFKGDQHVLAVFLNIKSAFNNVNCEIPLQALADLNCPQNIIELVKFLMYEIRVYADVLGNEFRYLYKGVPQGGVLSPLLFIIYINLAIKNLPKSAIISKFADHIAIIVKRKSLESGLSLTEKSARIMKEI